MQETKNHHQSQPVFPTTSPTVIITLAKRVKNPETENNAVPPNLSSLKLDKKKKLFWGFT